MQKAPPRNPCAKTFIYVSAKLKLLYIYKSFWKGLGNLFRERFPKKIEMYKTETHLHTAESSGCGKLSAEEIIIRCHDAGYNTVFVSDHFTAPSLARFGNMPWEETIERYLCGFRAAETAGRQLGMHILLSAEIRFNGSVNDYLLYGIDETFLLSCRDAFAMGIHDFLPYAHAHGVTVIQAHPLRDGKCIPTPQDADGFEVYNSNPRHDNHSADALALAKQYGILITSGSDAHRIEDIAGGGILTDMPITSAAEYIAALRSGQYRCIGTPEQI